jgi:hypothetical protein
MSKWNPFYNLLGIKEGWKIREENNQRRERKAIHQTPLFQAVAGREAVYREGLQIMREEINSIESLQEAMDRLSGIGRGRVTPQALERLPGLSVTAALEAFPHIDGETLAEMNLLVRRIQRLARERDSVAGGPFSLVLDSQTEYYRNLPSGDRCRLRPNEEWSPGDAHRPFNPEAFEAYRNRRRR